MQSSCPALTWKWKSQFLFGTKLQPESASVLFVCAQVFGTLLSPVAWCYSTPASHPLCLSFAQVFVCVRIWLVHHLSESLWVRPCASSWGKTRRCLWRWVGGSPGLVTWTCAPLLAFCRPLCSSAFATCPLCLSLGIAMSAVYEHCHWNTHWNDISHKATPMLMTRRWHWMRRGICRLLSALGGDRKPMCCCTFQCTVTEKTNLASPPWRLIAQPRLKKKKKNTQWRGYFCTQYNRQVFLRLCGTSVIYEGKSCWSALLYLL